MININLRSVKILCQTIGNKMIKRGQGKIINLASILSFIGGINVCAYATSKGAIVSLTKALANEWACKNINVNAIAPGYIKSDLTSPLLDKIEIIGRIPAGRWGEAEDLIGAVVFLASNASNYIHGHTLIVDGGWMSY